MIRAQLICGRLRNVVFILFLLRWTRVLFYQLKGRGVFGSLADLYTAVRRYLYGVFLRLPGVRAKVQTQVAESLLKLERKLVPSGPGVERITTLPPQGWSVDAVRAKLGELADMEHTRWEDGRVSGAVYHGGDELIRLQTEAFGKFTVSNPIHPDVFPGVRKMEAEVVAMVLSLFSAPDGAVGVTTSGGTESILMACLSARNKARVERGVTQPEMILPETAHTAFRKAGEYFNIKVHLVACRAPSYKVHLPSVSRLINPNTVLLVGSAPNFPHGIIDDIAGLSKLAHKKKLPLHVDCCLGSFIIPLLPKAGFDSEPFDFRLKGVTSISCDTHKYGFAPKGNSTVLYRNDTLRKFQYFISPDWSGGVYASPSIAGSRPGALIAGCWASLVSQGENGYVSACHQIVGAMKKSNPRSAKPRSQHGSQRHRQTTRERHCLPLFLPRHLRHRRRHERPRLASQCPAESARHSHRCHPAHCRRRRRPASRSGRRRRGRARGGAEACGRGQRREGRGQGRYRRVVWGRGQLAE